MQDPSLPRKSAQWRAIFCRLGKTLTYYYINIFFTLLAGLKYKKCQSRFCWGDAGTNNTVVCWYWGKRLRVHTLLRSKVQWLSRTVRSDINKGLSSPFACCNFLSLISSLVIFFKHEGLLSTLLLFGRRYTVGWPGAAQESFDKMTRR